MSRTKPAEERRADLLAAGKELFLAQGIAATSLEDITSRAGVSKGLFYLYFRSKDDLLLALQDQFSVELAERIRAATAAVEDWAGKLDACVQAIFDSYVERYELHEVLFHHGGHVPAGHSAHGLARHAIRDLLADGTAAGAFDVADPEATAVLCWASTRGFDPNFEDQPQRAEDARLLRAAQHLFRRTAGVAR
jgi:TetR/AcrR family transcriptional regulator, transcriptional repressor for nem operon